MREEDHGDPDKEQAQATAKALFAVIHFNLYKSFQVTKSLDTYFAGHFSQQILRQGVMK